MGKGGAARISARIRGVTSRRRISCSTSTSPSAHDACRQLSGWSQPVRRWTWLGMSRNGRRIATIPHTMLSPLALIPRVLRQGRSAPVRGGSYYSKGMDVRSFARERALENASFDSVGFRVVMHNR